MRNHLIRIFPLLAVLGATPPSAAAQDMPQRVEADTEVEGYLETLLEKKLAVAAIIRKLAAPQAAAPRGARGRRR